MSDESMLVALVPCRVWATKDMMGTVHIMRQHEGEDAFELVRIRYHHSHTSNALQHDWATRIMDMLGGGEFVTADESVSRAKYRPDDFSELCSYINAHPAVQSLLYDMDLMPEQCVSEDGWNWLRNVVGHFKAHGRER